MLWVVYSEGVEGEVLMAYEASLTILIIIFSTLTPLQPHWPPLFLRHTTFIPTFLLHTMVLSAWNARPPISTWYLLSLPSILAQMLLLQEFYPDCSIEYSDLPGFHSPLHLPYTAFQPLLNICHCLTYDILCCGIYCSSH